MTALHRTLTSVSGVFRLDTETETAEMKDNPAFKQKILIKKLMLLDLSQNLL